MIKLLENGEYFRQARIWYNENYLLPYTTRSVLVVISTTLLALLIILWININYLFPINMQIRYAINVEDASDYSAMVTPANAYDNDVRKSIAQIFVQTYVEIREGYNYSDLASRMLYIQTTSSKALYNKYANYISLDNSDSPVLRFQKYAKRVITVKSVNVLSDVEAIITFNAKSTQDNGKNLEDTDWETNISFSIDKIDISLPENTPFNFTVNDYKVKFIRDNNVK